MPVRSLAIGGAVDAERHSMLTASIALLCALLAGPPAEDGGEIGLEMLRVPAGSFMIGSPPLERGRGEDETQRRVTFSSDFLIAAHELTQAQWKAVMGTEPGSFRGGADLPVENVSWLDALHFCNELSARAGLDRAYTIIGTSARWNRNANGYRLPTEAEWEYACRGGTTTHFWPGDRDGVLRRIGWYSDNSANRTHAVGRKVANPWGLYDVHGNVWEWCWDLYGDYPSDPAVDPAGPSDGSARTIRGGGWNTVARQCRSASRHHYDPDNYCNIIGFRVARSTSGSSVPAAEKK
ncbi:MAG: serine/threonine protein kinase [Gemmatimonadetes bacterium]|nr:serine/threonine protein kinase [Gemmatimonadota bacterium]